MTRCSITPHRDGCSLPRQLSASPPSLLRVISICPHPSYSLWRKLSPLGLADDASPDFARPPQSAPHPFPVRRSIFLHTASSLFIPASFVPRFSFRLLAVLVMWSTGPTVLPFSIMCTAVSFVLPLVHSIMMLLSILMIRLQLLLFCKWCFPVGCLVFLSNHPAFFEMGEFFPEFLSHLSSLMDPRALPDATAPAPLVSNPLEGFRALSTSPTPASDLNASPESDLSNRISLVVGTLVLAVLLAGAASHYID